MQNLDEIEDGELSDEASSEYIEPYQALERPSSFAPIHKPVNHQLPEDDSDESTSESSEDSSEDERCHPAKKRRKVSAKPPPPRPAGKRNVWSSVLFEDHIEKELKDVNVQVGHHKLVDKSRDVESYYKYGSKLGDRLGGEDIHEAKKIKEKLVQLDKKDGSDSFQPEEAKDASNDGEDFEQTLQETQKLLSSRKRKMDERDDAPKKKSGPRRPPRFLRVEDLSVTASSSPLEVAQDIALKLHEEKMDLISRTIDIIGVDAAIDLFKETQEVENDGGIFVADGSRRRTPGGVFFYLLRNHEEIPMEKIREVFSEEAKAKEKHKRYLRAIRRNQQAERLKQSITDAQDLPPLPTRAELELQKVHDQQAGASGVEPEPTDNVNDADEDENVIDIHFECE